ncbi:myrosinase 1-like isoform X2 [Venturia canescens]|uniref:myrosinase 1-like isoform X2 n=1 Tax=Venturia canescens TaxID=32260 RepID=UPI001C9D0F81|nr:myrosinase 1-like isoform X2 [Venturia canescens]
MSNADVKHDVANYLRFPEGFVIGASTAAHQIEGSWNATGKGISIWDHYTHADSSRIMNHDNADIACDSYNKYKQDIQLLKELGFDAYRFSISWTRILPTGFSNTVNRPGIEHYKNLIDELLANGIEPIVTMLHWDHPQSMEDLGGWTNEKMIDWFVDYARILFQELGPKVKKWVTMNEPEAHCVKGYSLGDHAPGKKVHGIAEYLCTHNALKAHASVYRLYQNQFKSLQNGIIGLSFNMMNYYPKNPNVDQTAADTAFTFGNGWMFHPIFSATGDYPEIIKKLVAENSARQGFQRSRLPEFTTEWVNKIRGSADFLGLNHYTSWLVESGATGSVPSFLHDRGISRSPDPAWEKASSTWLNVVPEGFGDLLRKIASDYGNPVIYVLENGVSDRGETLDLFRIRYYHDYVKSMLIAMNRDHVNVKGYFVWSLLDNFEWDMGYSECFGIVKVNFTDPERQRTPKESALWWKRVLKSRHLEPVP